MTTKFSIGYNGERDFEDIVAKYKDRIAEVYFVAPYTHPARRVGDDALEYVHALRLHEALKFLRPLDIAPNMLFNAFCLGDMYGSDRRFAILCEQVDFYWKTYGVSAVTVVSSMEGELIKHEFLQIRIHGSTNMFIRTVTQAVRVKHFVDVLTPDREINRDLDMLRAIKKAIGKPLRILANEGCIPECPYRVQHLNRLSHESPPFEPFFLPGTAVFAKDPATILKSPIIRPEDLHYYKDIAGTIKLASRASSNRQLDLILHAYTTEHYSGNLFSLMECGCLSGYLAECEKKNAGSTISRPAFDSTAIPSDFFSRVTTCSRLCENCSYCNHIAQRAFQWPSTGTVAAV